MPTYAYQCTKCKDFFERYSKSFSSLSIGDISKDVKCESCGANKSKLVWPDEIDIQFNIKEFRDRGDKVDEDRAKRSVDRDRAMKKRKKLFGSENVNVGKSEMAKRKHTFKREIVPQQRGSSTDIDKADFIKASARNPNAIRAAENVIRRRVG